MNWIEEIKRVAADPDAEVTRQWMEQAQQAAPYSVLPALLFLERNGVKGNEDVLSRLAVVFPDRLALSMLLGEGGKALMEFYPAEPEPETPDTVTTIDRFLDNYGKTSPGEVEAISRAIFNPQPDYADVLAAQEQETGVAPAQGEDDQDALISQFIAEQMHKSQQAARVPIAPLVGEDEKAEIAGEEIDAPTQNDDSMLQESLAKMYIARHKYSQALEIIERLSLNYPEKSIYFADQMRFLAKLVLNETLNDKK